VNVGTVGSQTESRSLGQQLNITFLWESRRAT
jgi:hypothetical protein